MNDGHWGTTCAAVGCMPSKALIEAATAFHRRHTFDEFGMRGAEALHADISAVLARVRRMRDGFVKGPEAVPEQLGDRAVSGHARLVGPGRLSLAIERQMTVADILAMAFYHPVLEEGLRSALRDLAKAVAGVGGSDLSDCQAIGHDALD